MGQKVHPYGFRLVSIRKPRSRWFAEGERYRQQLIEDIKAREFIHETQRNAGISDVVIDRTAETVTITIQAAKPGIMIGRGGRDVDRLRQRLEKMVSGRIRVNVEETPEPDLCAQLIAENIAWQIERRVSPRRAMGQAIERAMERGAQGARAEIAGRIGGAEIARRESMGPEGRVPLHTLRADIDFGITEARTGYGHIGIKVWVYRGDVLPPQKREEQDVWDELEAEVAQLGDTEAAPETAAETVTAEVAAEPGGETEAPAEPPETESLVEMTETEAESAVAEVAPEPGGEIEVAAELSETESVVEMTETEAESAAADGAAEPGGEIEVAVEPPESESDEPATPEAVAEAAEAEAEAVPVRAEESAEEEASEAEGQEEDSDVDA